MYCITRLWEQGYSMSGGSALRVTEAWTSDAHGNPWGWEGNKPSYLAFTPLLLAAFPLTFVARRWHSICTCWRRPYLSLGLYEWLSHHQYRPPRASLLRQCTSRQAFAPPFLDGTKVWGRLQGELRSWCYVGWYQFCIRSQSNIFHAFGNR